MANLTLAPEDDFDMHLAHDSGSERSPNDTEAVSVRRLYIGFNPVTEFRMTLPWPRTDRLPETEPDGKQIPDQKQIDEERQ
jgi:hypothetical protein